MRSSTRCGMLFGVGILASLVLSQTATAESLAERADALVQSVVAAEKLAGVSAAIAVEGKIVWSGGAGFADLENKIPATSAMVHRIASISKAMTATAVMQLVEAGKIGLDEPVQTYLPAYPISDKGTIRIRHLLSHTSGTRHYFGKENRPTDHYAAFSDAMAVFQNDPIAFEPGTRYRYTTYGYTVLGAVIESVSSQSYADYMRDHVWVPAGMTSTSLEIKGETVPNKARLYIRNKEGAIVDDPADDLSVKYPGGGIQSTAEDLVRFAIAFMDGKLLKTETRDLMFHAPDVKGRAEGFLYGYGWIYGDAPDVGQFYRHDGGQAGTSTNLLVLPEQRIAVAVLANLYEVSGPVQKTTWDLAHAALKGDPE